MALSLSSKFIATVVSAIALVSVSVLTVEVLTSQKTLREQKNHDLQTQAANLSDLVSIWVDSLKTQGGIYSRIDSVATLNLSTSVAFLAKELPLRQAEDNLISNMIVVERNGMGHYPNGKVLDVSHVGAFPEAKSTKSFIKEKNPVISPSTGKVVMGMYYPLFKNDEINGVFILSISLEYLAALTKKYSDQYTTVFITSSDGTFIAHDNPDFILKKNIHKLEGEGTKGLDEVGKHMESGEKGMGSYSIGGISKTLAYHPIGSTGWSLGVSEENSKLDKDVLAGMLSSILNLCVTVLIVLLISIPLVLWMTRNIRIVHRELMLVKGDDSTKGDLTKRIKTAGKDELGSMADFFNTFLESLQSIVRVVKEQIQLLEERGHDLASNMEETSASVIQINSNLGNIEAQISRQGVSIFETREAVQDIGNNVANLTTQLEQQNSALSQASAAVEEMISNLGSITANIGQLGTLVGKLSSTSDNGKAKLNATIAAIRTVSEKSEGLEETNKIISSIAAQTNLLAMNASIEAAHAGTSGRGFSVVADEIRKLAEKASDQSREIKGLLTGMRQSIGAIVQNAADTETSFEDILNTVKTVSGMEQEVRFSLTEQNSGSNQILESLSKMKELTQIVQVSSNRMGQSSEAVKDRMDQLNQISGTLVRGISEISIGTKEINQAIVNVDSMAQENRKAIGAVSEVIGQLRT